MSEMASASPSSAASEIASGVSGAPSRVRWASAPGRALGDGDLRVADQRPASGDGLEASDLAAPAERIGVGDPHVPDVARRSVRAAVDATVREESGTDARADLAVDQVEAARRGAAPLAEREQVDVVVDPHRRVVALLEAPPDVESVPARHDRRCDGAARLEVDRARDADADAPHRHVAACARAPRRSSPAPCRASRPGHGRCPTRDASGRGRRRRAARTPTWMCSAPSAHTMIRPRLAAEAQRAGGAAAGRRAELAVLEVAHLDRLIDPLRDDSAAEAGDAADLGPGRGVAGAHHVDDAQEARHLVGLSAEAQCGLLGHG